MLASVKIVGTRFYPGAHEYLYKVSRFVRETEEKCLYLVPEINNQHDSNAVMLHNGKMKLGNVAVELAPQVRSMLTAWAKESGSEDVVACTLQEVQWNVDLLTFKQQAAHNVQGRYRVNERMARKFSDKFRKD